MEKRRMCPACRAFVTTDDKICPYCQSPIGPRAIDARQPSDLLGGFIPHARFVTVLILTVNIGLYLATTLYSMRAGYSQAYSNIDARTLYLFGAKLSTAIFGGQYWRLVTAGFLHGGLLHIGMNSWVLFDVGAQVEEIYGTSRMVTLYFVASVSGFIASTFWSNSLSIGASAGIFGLLGAMVALGVSNRSPYAQAVRGIYMRWALSGLILFLVPGIDNAAHVGGFAGGFATAWIAGLPTQVPHAWKDRIWNWAAAICLALTAAAFSLMYLQFDVMRQFL